MQYLIFSPEISTFAIKDSMKMKFYITSVIVQYLFVVLFLRSSEVRTRELKYFTYSEWPNNILNLASPRKFQSCSCYLGLFGEVLTEQQLSNLLFTMCEPNRYQFSVNLLLDAGNVETSKGYSYKLIDF